MTDKQKLLQLIEILFPAPIKNEDGSFTDFGVDCNLDGALEDILRGNCDDVVRTTITDVVRRLYKARKLVEGF